MVNVLYLTKLHFRPLPAMESGYYDEKNVLLEAIKSLSDLIMQTAEATKVIRSLTLPHYCAIF